MKYKVSTAGHQGVVDIVKGASPLFIAAIYIAQSGKSVGTLIEISGGEYKNDPAYVAGMKAFEMTGYEYQHEDPLSRAHDDREDCENKS